MFTEKSTWQETGPKIWSTHKDVRGKNEIPVSPVAHSRCKRKSY